MSPAFSFRPVDLLPPEDRERALSDLGFARLFERIALGPHAIPDEETAAELSMRSPATFRRHIRFLLRMNWRTYTASLLAREARIRLSRGPVRIEELSRQFGYTCETSFSRAFRRWYGEAPKRYQLYGGPAAKVGTHGHGPFGSVVRQLDHI